MLKTELKSVAGVSALALAILAFTPEVSLAGVCVAISPLTNPDGELLNADACGVIENVPNGPGNNDQDETAAVSTASGLALTYLDKDEPANDSDNGFLFTGTAFDGDGQATEGTWAIDISALVLPGPFTDFVVAMKDGNPLEQGLLWFNVDTTINTPAICPPGYAYCGEWKMYGNDTTDPFDTRHGISHMNLYGVTGQLPEPAGLLLLGTILGGIGMTARRRNPSA